jgi:hypothetical protein
MAPFAQKRALAPLPTGRPSEYRPEYDEMVIECMAQGLSLTAFAGMVRVSRETVYRWKSAHSTFRDAVSRGETARNLHLERKLLAARYGAQCSAAQFALRNANPDEWKDLRAVQHQHQHALVQLTDAQLHAIAAGSAAEVGDGVTIEGEAQHLNER